MIALDRLARAFLETHPPRAARRLEQMPPETAAGVLRAIPPRSAAAVLREMTAPHASDCLEHLGAAEGAAIVAELTADEAGSVMRALEPVRRDPLLTALPADVREPITRVLPYPEGTAGAVMDPTIFQLPHDVLVADARARLGRAHRDRLYYLYVVDREHRLVGVLDVFELLRARARDPISVVMQRDVDRLSVWLPLAMVRDAPGWQSYHSMPVVDDEDRLVGAIRYPMLRKLERQTPDRGADPARLTATALAEIFQLGTTGMVSAIAGAAAARDLDRPIEAGNEVPHAD